MDLNSLLKNSDLTYIQVCKVKDSDELVVRRFKDNHELDSLHLNDANLVFNGDDNNLIPLIDDDLIQNAYELIIKHDKDMERQETEAAESLQFRLEGIEDAIGEREENRPENDNTVYDDEGWREQEEKNAFEWIAYLL